MVGGAAFAPAGHKLSGAAGEAGPHVGVAEGKDLALFVDALRRYEFEVSIAILGNGQVGDGAGVGIELGQLSAAGLAVEHFYDLHGRFLVGNIRVAGTAVADDGDVVVEVDGVHLSQLAGAGNGL